MQDRLIKLAVRGGFTLMALAAIGAVAVAGIFYAYSRNLPDVQQLANYQPDVVTRLYAGDGRLIAEYAKRKRIFVPIQAIPLRVRNAFLAAEDKDFYSHSGVDFLGILRAAITNIRNLGSGRRLVGASTITQQVTKNFLLSSEVSLKRKVKEMILAFRIEKVFSKNKILELYLNQIYLGFGAYGVASAALQYFNKSLDDLTIAEAAFLAALPKAPANYNPRTRPVAAKDRRDWVIDRMVADGAISATAGREAKAQPLTVASRSKTEFVHAGFFGEDVRRELLQRYGEKRLYTGGLSVRTTLDPRLQKMANKAVRMGLDAYDRRHGWRGPLTAFSVTSDWPDRDWAKRLAAFAVKRTPPGLYDWKLAVVLRLDEEAAYIGFKDGTKGRIPLAEMTWARRYKGVDSLGPAIKAPADVLRLGQVVPVAPVAKTKRGKPYPPNSYRLEQIPAVEGAMVVMDPQTGRVLAMVGGYAEFTKNLDEFNRATQAERQPGSAFKPFVYLTALDNGFTPSSLVLDAPFVIDQGAGLGKWKPQNYGRKFYGPSTLRIGIEKSRNVMTVRLAERVGMDKIVATAKKFGIADDMKPQLAMAIGAGDTTLLRLTTAYAMLDNGGKRVTATLIDRVQDRNGKTIFRQDRRPCPACQPGPWAGQAVPVIPDTRKQIDDPRSVYQVVSMMIGVIQRGTGVTVRSVGKPLAGKTGTTNDSVDAWFMGFSPDLVAGVWVGFDRPRTLGRREAGSRAAGPIFREFMKMALAGKPATPFRVPRGVTLIKVDHLTGLPPKPGDTNVITEVFKTGRGPMTNRDLVGGGLPTSIIVNGGKAGKRPSTGTGGLY